MPRTVTRAQFLRAADAVWEELAYQDNLPRRTEDEALSIPAFLSLLRRYIRKAEDDWADRPGVSQPDGTIQVSEALDGLRKIAAIGLRAMIYNGTRRRPAASEQPRS